MEGIEYQTRTQAQRRLFIFFCSHPHGWVAKGILCDPYIIMHDGCAMP